MNSQLLILNEINEQGKVMFPLISDALKHDISQQEFGKIISELNKRRLIQFDKDKLYVEITEIGVNKLINLQQEKADIERSKKMNNLKEQFEFENLRLQNENLNYLKTLRDKESDITKLTIKNLKLQNRQFKWNLFFIVMGLIIGFVTSNFNWILQLFGVN